MGADVQIERRCIGEGALKDTGVEGRCREKSFVDNGYSLVARTMGK